MRFAYADPPYFGCCGSHYDHVHGDGVFPFDGGCWDDKETHEALADYLNDEYPDGWALSCNPRDLRMYLDVLPDDVRVAPWCKSWHQIRPTTVQYAWEPVIFRGGRVDPKRAPMVRDWLVIPVTRQTGLKGAKPAVFNQWVLDLLAYKIGEDTLDDLFPGTHGMTRALDTPTLDFREASA